MAVCIDVHNHFLTPRYLREMSEADIMDVDGFPIPKFHVEKTLEIMEKFGISTSMLSISSPAVSFVQGKSAGALARSLNEDCAVIVDTYPTRFGSFAVLPLPDVDAALIELEYALDVLKLDGVGLLTNYVGRYLAEPEFRPLFQEINRRKAVVFFHPTQPPGFEALSQDLPAPMLEYPFDTTRMISGLISKGILRDFADMRLIVAHGGGAIPYLMQRIVPLISSFSKTQPPLTTGEVVSQLKSLYYDLTATASPSTIEALRRFAPPDHLLYGTDFPFMPEITILPLQQMLKSDDYFTDTEQKLFFETTPTRLFPRLATINNVLKP